MENESAYNGIITPQFVDKILSNYTCLETRIQLLPNVVFIVEKVPGVHVQSMLKMRGGLYTGGKFK